MIFPGESEDSEKKKKNINNDKTAREVCSLQGRQKSIPFYIAQ